METIGVITSGGDAPGMNPALRAVVRTACGRGLRVLGFMRAYQGIIDGDHVELNPRSVAGLTSRGGTILKTARCKEWHSPEGRGRGAARLRDLGVDGLVVIGGDGSFRGAHALMTEHGVPCVGIPGTIDNDLLGTDYTIGFHTAVQTAVECVDKLRDTAESHERLFLIEVMGRHSGMIAAAVGLACGAEEILVPEEPMPVDRLRASLERAKRRGKRSLVVVIAEGDECGGAMAVREQLALDQTFDIRAAIIGHIQRGGSPLAFDRIIGGILGHAAVEALVAGRHGIMVGVQHNQIAETPLEKTFTERRGFNLQLLGLARAIS